MKNYGKGPNMMVTVWPARGCCVPLDRDIAEADFDAMSQDELSAWCGRLGIAHIRIDAPLTVRVCNGPIVDNAVTVDVPMPAGVWGVAFDEACDLATATIEIEPPLDCDHCESEVAAYVGGERLCMGHTLQALLDARDGNRQRDAVIAEMTRTIAGLRGVPEAVEPGYGVENLAMMGRWGR